MTGKALLLQHVHFVIRPTPFRAYRQGDWLGQVTGQGRVITGMSQDALAAASPFIQSVFHKGLEARGKKQFRQAGISCLLQPEDHLFAQQVGFQVGGLPVAFVHLPAIDQHNAFNAEAGGINENAFEHFGAGQGHQQGQRQGGFRLRIRIKFNRYLIVFY